MINSSTGDNGNIAHLARHGIAPTEAEQAILDPHALMVEIQESGEERVKAVGLTAAGKIIVVVFTFRGDTIRPITSYDAPHRLQQLYLRGESI